jgi:spore coat polysaccharide biosynthesis predicted glycosyltransferase SpsG
LKVAILTEGNNRLGFGHISRCNAIYDLFNKEKVMVKLFINGDESIKTLIKGKEVIMFNWIDQQKRILGILRDYDVVFIDSYLSSFSFYEKISQIVPVPIYLDDTKRIEYPRGILLNWVINAQLLNYPYRKDLVYLLGIEYAILRKNFWNTRKKKINKNIKTMLITLGGTDLRNLTPKLLKNLCENHPNIQKRVIIAKGFQNVEEIKEEKDDKTILIYNPDAAGMKKQMMKSDIAISGCGQTLLELAFLGVPTIGISISKNQVFNALNWEKIGFLEFAGMWEQKNLFEVILEKFNLLMDFNKRVEKRDNGIKTINLDGKYKIMKSINNYLKNQI